MSNARVPRHLFICLIVGLALRAYRLNFQSLWMDELLTYLNSSDAFTTVLLNSQDINIPPLYYLFINFLISFVDDFLVLRVPSLLFGSVTIVLFYYVLTYRFGTITALVGACLLSISPFHVWYSQEARPYGLLVLLSLVTVFCLEHAVKNANNRWWKVAFVTSATATVYCHTVAVAFLSFLATYLVLAAPGQKWREWLVPFGSVAVLTIPVAYRLLVVPPVGSGNAFEPTNTIASIAYTLWAFGTGFSLGPTVAELHMPDRASIIWGYLPLILPVMLVLCFLVIFGAFQLLREDLRKFWFVTLWFCFPLGFALIGSILTVHPFNVRYSILAFPPFLILISLAIIHMKDYWRRSIVATGIVLISLASLTNYFFNERYHRDDNRSAGRFLSLHAHSGDIIIASAAYTALPLRYYYQGEPIKIVGYPTHKSLEEDNSTDPDPPGALYVENGHPIGGDIERIIGDRQRFWLFLSRVYDSDPYGAIPDFLNTKYSQKLSASWPGTQLILYEIRSESPRTE